MKIIACIILVISTLSCSTLKTIAPAKNHVNISHFSKKSYCEEIPRVYSGLSYNFCLLYGEPSKYEHIGNSFNHVPFFVIDTSFSVIADTILLPHTIVMQLEKGDIKVN